MCCASASLPDYDSGRAAFGYPTAFDSFALIDDSIWPNRRIILSIVLDLECFHPSPDGGANPWCGVMMNSATLRCP